MERYEIGTLIGSDRYRIEEPVHVAGETDRDDRYRATDEITERDVLVSLGRPDDELPIVMARAAARLGSHENIVPVLDAGRHDGRAFVVTANVDAVRLDHHGGSGSIETCVAVARAVCRALVHAHSCGVAHGSLSMESVWLHDDTHIEVSGFAVLEATDDDFRNDLHDLGLLLGRLLPDVHPGNDGRADGRDKHSARNEDQALSRMRAASRSLLRDAEESVIHCAADFLAFLSGVAPTQDRTSRGRKGDYVGRLEETHLFERALDSVMKGAGRIVFLAGEPGIGKTRTAHELSEIAQSRGAMVLWGRCLDGETTPPYWPWVEVLRSFVRHVSEDSTIDVIDEIDEIASLLGAQPRPNETGDPTPRRRESARWRCF